MEQIVVNFSTAVIRRVKQNGREYLVAPMTLIVPGVLNGSKGSLFYPADEIGKDPAAWNGVPITVRHPVGLNGEPLSVRDGDVIDRQGIGFLKRATSNGKLKAEGWFDVEKTRRIDKRVLSALEAGKPIELSTGLYTDNESAENGAHFKGKSYTHVARNYRPDHLAILLDQTGACSVRDGCGVLVNKGKTENVFCSTGEGGGVDPSCSAGNELSANYSPDQPRDEAGRFGEGAGGVEGAKGKGNAAQQNYPHIAHLLNGAEVHSEGHSRKEAITTAKQLRAKGTFASIFKDPRGERGKNHIVVVPEKTPPIGNVGDTVIANSDEDESIESPKNQDGHIGPSATQNKGGPTMAKTLTANERKEIVEQLIGGCCWNEEDRETLNGLSDRTLTGLHEEAEVVGAARVAIGDEEMALNAMPAALAAALAKKGKKPTPDEEVPVEETPAMRPAAPGATCNEEKPAKPATEAEWLDQAPPTIREAVTNAQQIVEREKTDLIGRLTANVEAEARKTLTVRLQRMSLDDLRGLAPLAMQQKASQESARLSMYLGAAAPVDNVRASVDQLDDVLPLPMMDWNKLPNRS